MLMEQEFAQSLGVKVKDVLNIGANSGAGGMEPVGVVGLITSEGAASMRMAGVIILPIRTAQHFWASKKAKEERHFIDSIQIVLAENVDAQRVQDAIEGVLPAGLILRRPSARTQNLDEMLLSTDQALILTTYCSLLLAGFIILNTFLMNVGERRAQLATMRAIGATRWQIAKMVLGESLVMGVLGTLLGILAGLGGAAVLSNAMGRLTQAEQPPMELRALPFILGATFGLLISLIASIIPAVRAAKLTPLEGMAKVSRSDMEGTSYRFTLIGLLITLGSGGVLGGCIAGAIPSEASVLSGIIMMLGIVMLLPEVLEPLSNAAMRIVRPLLGPAATLAQRQVLRHRARSTLTVGVLFIACSTGIGISNAILDNVNDVRKWYKAALMGDFFLRAAIPDQATGAAPDLPEAVVDEVKHVAGIESLDATRFITGRVGKSEPTNNCNLLIREFQNRRGNYFDLRGGNPEEVRQRLLEGEIAMSTVLAQRLGVQAGDTVRLGTAEGPQPIRVAALVNEYMFGGMTIYMQRDVARRLLHVTEGVSALVIKARPDKIQKVKADLQAIADRNGIILHSYADLVKTIEAMISGIDSSLWGLLVLCFAVAAIGVVNTLTMNVLEQTRELGLLRIVAMTRAQVRKAILGQAAILGGLGLVPGSLAGVGVGYLIHLASIPMLGHPVDFGFRPAMIAGALVLGLIIVILAAWIPAARATRLVLSKALQYE
jgi:putative ABC transport system permease protein